MQDLRTIVPVGATSTISVYPSVQEARVSEIRSQLPPSLFIVATLGLLAASGCKDPENPFDPSAEAEVPEWIQAEWEQNKRGCDSSPYWDSTAHMATTHYAGSYFEDKGSLFGNEFWLLYPNTTFEDIGFTECTVVWDVAGTITDSSQPGAAYAIALSATIDEEQTTCPVNWEDIPIYVGFEEFTENYNVVETPQNGVSLSFDSGTQFATGRKVSNGIQWFSDKDCKVF